MGEFLEYFKTKKNLVNLLVLGILVLALPIGINLIRQQQIFKSRAVADPIVFKGDNVALRNGEWVALKPLISLLLTSPLGPSGVAAATTNHVSTTPTGSACSGNSCSDCILNGRSDILPFFKTNGWDISCANQGKVVTNWCTSVDPSACKSLKAGTCASVCGTTTLAPPLKKSAPFSLVKTAYAAETCSNGTKNVGDKWIFILKNIPAHLIV